MNILLHKVAIVGLVLLVSCQDRGPVQESVYLNNRPPLASKAYLELPLGSISPEGWLLQQLQLMKKGMTGHLDELYPSVLGPRNGWLGGDGDGWERGPYWLDGLVPLAWILDDPDLKAKAMPWIEWTLNSQTEEGYFGPVPFTENPASEPGIQKSPRRDWWPKMVMLKVLQQYYDATGDERVITLMTNYFRYQLSALPETPLDHWSFWGNRRGGDNLLMVYWLYNITGEAFLLELAELIHEQTFPWTAVFLNEDCHAGPDRDHLFPASSRNSYPFDRSLIDKLCLKQQRSFHCVNLAQGIKEPIIFYQQDPDPKYVEAVKKAFRDIREYHGQPQGMYGGDEALHGRVPTQGIEFCSVTELMFSLEKMIGITGDVDFMDHLEKIAFNALPTQANDDFTARQYFQQANQVMLTRHRRNFHVEDGHGHTDLCYGLVNGYPCCTCNMHQGWPKFVQHLWYAAPDGGLAALMFAPSSLEAMVAGRVKVRIKEETRYPFEDRIRFRITLDENVSFPFHIRIPGWCKEARISINGRPAETFPGRKIVVLDQAWSDGDVIELQLPMHISLSSWEEHAVAVERGPLVYTLRIREDWNFVKNPDKWGDFYEVRPLDPWNYALRGSAINDPEDHFKLIESPLRDAYPWSLDNAPLELHTTGYRIPGWKPYNEMAGPLPHSLQRPALIPTSEEEIVLIPYGCTTLRITEFPVAE
jgi:DUF1680 family protein